MNIDSKVLNCFLDGELSPQLARQVEDALASDPDLQAEMEQLLQADALAKTAFADMLEQPVPLALTAAIKNAEGDADAKTTKIFAPSNWAMAASFAVALLIGGAGGYLLKPNPTLQSSSTSGWLNYIADYHRVYATEKRHLVEVAAAETDHIQKWLANTVGEEFSIPDLSEHGLTFEGARLLVAAGKPVAQLMFTDEDGDVVALCFLQSKGAESDIKTQTINELDLLSWNSKNRNIVIVGDRGRSDLLSIAQSAAKVI